MENTTAIYLKQAINNLSDYVKTNIKSNKILAITNLLSAGFLTEDEALKDEDFREFMSKMKTHSTIKAKTKR